MFSVTDEIFFFFLLSHLYFSLLQIKRTNNGKAIRFTTDFTNSFKWFIYNIIHCICSTQTLLTHLIVVLTTNECYSSPAEKILKNTFVSGAVFLSGVDGRVYYSSMQVSFRTFILLVLYSEVLEWLGPCTC